MCFVALSLGFIGGLYPFYPDTPSAPRTFPEGLEAELGGKGAMLVGLQGRIWLI